MNEWALAAVVVGGAAILLTKNPVTQTAGLILDPLTQLEQGLMGGYGVPVNRLEDGVPIVGGDAWLNGLFPGRLN